MTQPLRAGATRPDSGPRDTAAVVAMIASPIQALNVLEYLEATGTELDLVLIGDGVAPEKTVPQIREVLAQLPQVPVHVRRTDGWSAGRPHWWGEMFAELLQQVLALGRPVQRLILGDFRVPAAFQLARVLGLAPEQITLVDDGMAMLLLDRGPGSAWERSLERAWTGPVPDDRMPRGIHVFTALGPALRLAAEDRVSENHYAFLRSRLSGLRVDPGLVVVVGSPFTVPGSDMSPARDLQVALELVRAARERFPGSHVVYAPHRRETEAKLSVLRAEVEVREFSVPFEMAPIELGAVPAAVMGFQSSLLANLPPLYADFPEVRILSFRAPEELFNPDRAQLRSDQFRFFEEHTGGRVAVEPLVLQSDGAARRVPLPWPSGSASLSLPLGELDAAMAHPRPEYFARLLATTSSDADAFLLAGGARRWRPWLGEVVAPQVRVLTDSSADVADDLLAVDKVVVYGGGTLDVDLTAFDGCPDVRIFWEEADAAVQEELLRRHFRLYAVDSDSYRWEQVASPERAVGLLYGVRKAEACTISIVTHWGGVMGGQRSHVEMVESLVRQGHMVDSLFPSDEGLGALVNSAGGSVTLVGPLPWWYHRPEEGEIPPHAPRLDDLGAPQAVLVQELRRRRPDVVLTQCALTPQGALAAAAVGIPHVWYLREFGDLDLGYRLPGTPAEVGARVAELSARVAANAEGVRDYFFPDDSERATVVYPAPSVPGPHAVRTSWAERVPGVFTVGVLASLQPGKGQLSVIEAVALLRDRGAAARVVLYGQGSPAYRRTLEEAARAYGVSALVDFAGLEPSRLRMFTSLDAVVVASRAEAFGRVAFEAAAFDVPIIYADAAGPAEYMRDGVTGLAFPPGDADALADAIDRLAQDPSQRERLAVQARLDLVGAHRRRVHDAQVHELVTSAVRSPGPAAGLQVRRAELIARLAESLGLSPDVVGQGARGDSVRW
ncbi:glycosyltransferase family 4 protein [Nocardioides sp. BP30]|uniref:glycosyltransferase family 4 protein n=1 Tax=Nocardioides sp. BP30 TaxID=3036374 RepID=UPI00246996BD|nr:glycosyltransferase family 4 protein [Nocardioides sp. BP30]WGL51909.1 glycosyltransferase family 4 protein [Nocardioides sp. BP30]